MTANSGMFRKLSVAAAVATASMGALGACGENAPTSLEEHLAQFSVSAEVSRAAFQAGDSTTVRVTVTNRTNRKVTTGILNSCVPLFDVYQGDNVVAPGAEGRICTANLVLHDFAPGQSRTVNYVWRGQNEAWAVQLSPGTYTVRGKLGLGDNAIRSEPVPLQIL